jgi:hypothetical protein
VFVLSILLLIAAVVLILVGRGRSEAGGWKIGAALSAVGAVLAGVFACVHVVSAYEVGVPVTFGKIGQPLNSGVQFKSPFTEVTSFSTRPVDLNLYDKDVVEVRSAQGGVLYADVTIKWAVIPAKAVELYRLAGSEEAVEERLVLPDSREIIRNVFAKHTSEEGYASAREQIGSLRVPQLRRFLVHAHRHRPRIRRRPQRERVHHRLVDHRGRRLGRFGHDRCFRVAAAAVGQGHDVAVRRGELVRADSERLAEGAADRDQEAAADAGRRGRLGHRGLRAEAVLPAVGGDVEAVAGEDSGAADAQFLRHRGDRAPGGGHGEVAGVPAVTSASSASTSSAISSETAEFGGGSSSPV